MNEFSTFTRQTLSMEAERKFRKEVISECEVTDSTYRLWRNGLNVPQRYHAIINQLATELFGETVFDDEK